MSFWFDAGRGLVIVRAEVFGPTGSQVVRLALDTGATRTLVHPDMLVTVGLDPAGSTDRVRITTGTGVEYVSRIVAPAVAALGVTRGEFPVLCHALPPSAQIDGLLGLDFLRATEVTIDFRAGTIDLA